MRALGSARVEWLQRVNVEHFHIDRQRTVALRCNPRVDARSLIPRDKADLKAESPTTELFVHGQQSLMKSYGDESSRRRM